MFCLPEDTGLRVPAVRRRTVKEYSFRLVRTVTVKEETMADQLLQVNGLKVSVEDKEILHGLDMMVNRGETHVLMGPNGAGKSTLGYALMGNPKYTVTAGSIRYEGRDITEETVDKRAREGIFLSFQNPLEVPGISLGSFIRSALEQRRGEKLRLWDFGREMKKAMEVLQMEETYGDRDLNMGFSGGEKKKAEILQLLMLRPTLAILDETDSGLDVDAVRTVSRGVEAYQKNEKGALLIITHSTKILESLKVDYTHVMVDGRIVATGDRSLVEKINARGFEAYYREAVREGSVRG